MRSIPLRMPTTAPSAARRERVLPVGGVRSLIACLSRMNSSGGWQLCPSRGGTGKIVRRESWVLKWSECVMCPMMTAAAQPDTVRKTAAAAAAMIGRRSDRHWRFSNRRCSVLS